MKCYFHWQQNMLTVATKANEAAVQASFIVSHIIAKQSRPFTDDAYVEGCIMKVVEMLCHEKQQLFKNILLQITCE